MEHIQREFKRWSLSCKLALESTTKHFFGRICGVERLTSISYRYQYNNLSFPIKDSFDNQFAKHKWSQCHKNIWWWVLVRRGWGELLRLPSVNTQVPSPWKGFFKPNYVQFFFSFFLTFHHSIYINRAILR